MHRTGEDRERLREELLSEEEISSSRFKITSQNLRCQRMRVEISPSCSHTGKGEKNTELGYEWPTHRINNRF